MIGLALKLFGAGRAIKRAVGAAGRWLAADWHRIAFAVLFALVAFLGVRLAALDGDRDQWRIASTKWQVAATEWRRALEQTRVAITAAAAAAEKAQADNLNRVAAARAAINERTTDELETRRAAADAAYRRLRRARAETDPGRADGADLSAAADATCRTFGAADCDRLSATLKAAQDNTDQLVVLQDWVAQNMAVPTSPAPEAAPQIAPGGDTK